MNTQFLYIVEGLLAGQSQSAVQFPVAPVTVLHTDVLVSAGNIEKFLWTERTWCLFMSSKMHSVCSRCATIHVTFTTYKTLACTFRTWPVLAALDVWWSCVVSVRPSPCVYCRIGGTQSGFSYNERAVPRLCRTKHLGKIYNP